VSPKDGPKYLEKYALKANDAILAEDKHMPM
jgi:adenosine kinase